MNVYCFYHSADLDGRCSAEIVRRHADGLGHGFFPRPVDYGAEPDWLEGAGPGSQAVVADFTPEGDAAATLARMDEAYGNGVIWIDHHKTALEKAGFLDDIAGARVVGMAACELTWKVFYRSAAVPEAVRLLGRYDVFDRSDPGLWESRILPFQYGMRLLPSRPAGDLAAAVAVSDTWEGLLAGDAGLTEEIRARGAVCLEFERQNNARTALFAGYDCLFEGLFCCAANAGGNSLVLDAYARPEHKMRILWRFAKGRWRVSLYENGHPDVDCGAIAADRGGGGHSGAAGFGMPGDVSPLVFFPPAEAGE